MKGKLLSLLAWLCLSLTVTAQNPQRQQHAQTKTRTLQGSVLTDKTRQPLELATVRLLTQDSTLVTGTFTDSLGNYTLHTDRRGPMIVLASYVSFESAAQDVRVGGPHDTIQVNDILLKGDDIALRSAVVTATVAKMEQMEDTTVFNASAYRTPEGANLEALIKLFPGIEVGDDGKITWNGKEVKEFLINGKDFFKGDTDVAMKNLPVSLVKKIKAYDKKSDYAEQTGIDDGEETTVLDIMTKRELNQTLVTNIDVAGGWDWDDHALYSAKMFATRFTDRSRYTVFASRNNIGDASFGGRGGGGAGSGITTSTMAGFDFSWENDKKRFEAGRFELNGNVRYNGRDNDTESTASSQSFMSGTTAQSFQNSHAWRSSLSHNVNSSLRLQWCPDSLTSIALRPSYSFSKSKGTADSRSATFDQDPFEQLPGTEDADDVLDHFFDARNGGTPLFNADSEDAPEWLVNLNRSTSLSESQSHSVSAELNATRRLTGKAGRNVSVTARGGWSRSEAFSYSKAQIFTRQNTAAEGETPAFSLKDNTTHQFSTTPQKNWNVNVGGSYVEPLVGKWFGELRYNYERKFQDSDRALFDLYDAPSFQQLLANQTQFATIGLYRAGNDAIASWTTDPLQALSAMNADDVLAAIRDASNSQYAQYNYSNHSVRLGIRYNTEKVRFNAAVNFNPEHTVLDYERLLLDTTVVRNVHNFRPEARLRLNFSKTHRLNIMYRGSSSQPSMTNLLPVVDTSNPLNISAGNTNLEPSWRDNIRIFFNGYNADKQQGIMVRYDFENLRRSISTLQIYDETNGVRYSRPENISGNWNTNANLTYNRGLGREKLFNIATSTSFNFNHQVGYSASKSSVEDFNLPEIPTYEDINRLFNRFMAGGAEKALTKTTRIGERLDLTYRRSLWDVALNGNMNYQHSVSNASNARNLDTWSFKYGATANVNLDCGLSISTDIGMNSRRGYSEASMNTNELIWNAQIAQSFLKGKVLTLSLQFYDILQQQSNISRSVTALMREDSWNNAINSYFMVHLIYKLNLFNGSRAQQEEQPPMGPPPAGVGYGSGRPGPGGRPMGGPGGNRPMGGPF